ncbi:putative flagellin with Flp1-like domain [Kineothrix alysoides]|uniref:Putative flagellin with Flp1-like domain n=1 Tax=Kineothrix alysoides TaxID=1469948 RepID=A0A4R1QVR1_9FIRM|nr:Flp1 family type IVb pilin [Kineothrix alysoides]TCL54280.1 putative flagellin with Flp1-like domain [Kineothrix alysoides]
MERKLKNFKNFIWEEDGLGTVEIILILVVLIGLVIIFKRQLQTLVTNVFHKITEDSNTIIT